MYINTDIDNRLNVNKLEELIDLPVVVKVNEFNEESVTKFSEAFNKALNTGQEVVPIWIDSYGGQVYSLLAMMDIIDNSSIPVATIGVGKMMSCGSILLTCGSKGMRYISSNSTVMIHDVSSFQWGKVEELKSYASETDRLNKLVYERMAKNCDQDKDYFLKQVFEKHHAEWFLNSKEAKKHKVIDHVGIPNFNIKISLDIGFGV